MNREKHATIDGCRADRKPASKSAGQQNSARSMDDEAHFRAILDAAPDALVIVNPEGRILFANGLVKKVFGYSRGELQGRSMEILLQETGETARQDLWKSLSSRAAGESIELTALDKAGRPFPVEVSVSPFELGGETLVTASIRDIRQRIRNEARQRLQAAALESTASGIAITDTDGHFVWVNSAFTKLTGYPQEEAIGKDPSILRSGWHDAGFYADMWETIEAGEVWEGELVNRRKDGNLYNEHQTITPVKNERGRVSHYIAIKTDITRLKEIEEDLRQSSRRLKATNEELEQFAYIASHDLQEPLRMITSYVQLLEKRYGDRLDQDADEFISFIVDGASRMRNLIQSLLRYSRLGTRELQLATVPCGEVVDEALKNLEVRVEEKEAVIDRDSLPSVCGDRSQLVQLFQNLVGNALKFTDGKRPRVSIRAEEEGGRWKFCVEDNGIGMDPRFSDRIFAVFQRLHRQDEYEGTGIGLALCRRIVDQHGGRIWVESEPGKGSRFFLTLPPAATQDA